MKPARDPDGIALLALARNAIGAAFGLAFAPGPDSPLFAARRGAFVTLTLRRRLRGCVGRVQADSPVGVIVPEMARAAAFQDPRFPPLERGELTLVTIEVSLLTVPRPVSSPEEVEVGIHGVIVASGGRRGLLLPQVATEWNWSREELLAHACEKASLAPDAWRRPGTRIEVFSAEVYAEEEG